MLGDLKLGQYVKLAPRVTFAMQIIGTVVGAILNCTSLYGSISPILRVLTARRRQIS